VDSLYKDENNFCYTVEVKSEKNTEAAFKWIVGILQKHSIPFQISGGFAAKLYGVDRDINDIDFGIPDIEFEKILPEIREYLIYGPQHYQDGVWDLQLMTLRYENQKIDIAGRDGIQFFDKTTNMWVSGHRDLTRCEYKSVYGISVPVIPKDSLIAYKKKIMREVDKFDIEALEM